MTSVFLAADPGADPVTYLHRGLVLSISPGLAGEGHCLSLAMLGESQSWHPALLAES